MTTKKIFLLLFILNSFIVLSQDYLMQNGTDNACSGSFLDSGGSTANYGNNESFVYTICPENAGQFVRLDFSSFVTQTGDELTIYDGDNTAATSLGTFSNANSPGIIIASSTSGCLTFEFISTPAVGNTGWEATISCYEPCQTITAVLDSTNPAPNVDGEIIICVGGDVEFVGSATFSSDATGATYTWDFGNETSATGTNVTATYNTPGIYVVDLIVTDDNPEGCNNLNSISQIVRVSPEIDFTGTQAAQTAICFGESVTIEGVAAIPPFDDCAPEIFEQTWLEDTQTTGQAASYSSTITVDCYGPGQVITDVTQITNICVDIEHSFIGDLDIYLVAPNGAQVHFLEYGDGNDPGAYFGVPDQADDGNPGVGWRYCFSPTAAQSINDVAVTGTAVASGVYAPLPTSSFNNIIGAPLNGNWTFIVTDLWAIDDGTLFSWNLNFDASLLPPTNSIVSEGWDADTTITNTSGNTITVQPPAAGQYCYTYRAMDDVGCEYTEEVCVDVIPEIIHELPNDLFICDAGSAPYLFDLTLNTPVLLSSNPTPSDFFVTYFNSQLDADNDTNPIDLSSSTSYSGTDGEIIYARVEFQASNCFETELFTLNLLNQPTINSVPDLELCDDISADGFESFDLSSQTLGILGGQDPASFNVTYYTSFSDADSSSNALISPYTNTINNEPIFIRIEDVGGAGCINVSLTPLFNLVVHSLAEANQPDNLELCDDLSADGFESFDLESQTLTILGTQDPLLFTVTYHESQAEADSFSNALVSPYNNTTVNQQTIYARVEELVNPTCFQTISFETIVNPLPNVIVVTPLEVCDDDYDGFTQFVLEDKNTEILNGQTDISVSYYENQIDADNGTNALISPFVNTISNTQTLIVRLENDNTGCINTTGTLDIVVNPLPIPVSPPILEACDDDNDGFTIFDFTGIDAIVIGAQSAMTVSYHETQSDAESGVNSQFSPYSNINPNSQILYIRLEDDSTGCFATTTMLLQVNFIPEFTSISSFELCDYNNPGDESEQFDLSTKDAEIINGQNASISYYENLTDAEQSINPIVGLYSNTSNPQIIYASLTDNVTGCSSIDTFNLIVNPLPLLVSPTSLDVCDDGVPDGLTEIDLSVKDQEIRGGNSNYSVTYYLNQVDADIGVNQLSVPYTNISNPQTIYARGEDIVTGCYSTTTLDLVVEQAPIANIPTPLEYCDADSDGFGVFTLTDADLEITGGVAGLTVSYHETMADANNNVNPLTSPYNNIVVDTQTVHARVESATIVTDCATIIDLVLVVNPEPQITLDLTPLEECDDNTDGFTQFDLTQAEAEVLNAIDPLEVTISYYETQANAEAATNALAVPTGYTNIVNPQEVWLRVEYNTTGCYKVTSLDLIVNELPVLVQPSPLELCDVNNPGDEQEAFILEDANAEVLNGQTGISITYYDTQADADAATNAIVSPYTNTVNPQTIYLRAVNDVTGCVNTITLDLRVNPIPSPEPNPTPIEVCDDDNDGFMSFDLESRTVELINGELDIVITYHETQSDAENSENVLVSPYDNIVADTQVVYVRAENTITGCFAVVELDLIVLPSPEIPLDIEDFVMCDDDDNGITQFDLTEMDAVIYDTQDPLLFILTYHLTQADAYTGNNPIVNQTSYTNASNPQTIYVRLESTVNGCVDTGEFNIVVELPPVPVQPTPLEICDDDYYAMADEIAAFDLTLKDAEITGGNASWIVTYYETDVEAQSDTNAIDPANAYSNRAVGMNPHNPQTLYVRVTDSDTGCYAFTTLTIRVLPNPTPSQDPLDIELCDDTATGDMQEVFNLIDNEAYIINGEAGVSATYHESYEDADTGSNAIADPTMYVNTGMPLQTIYVRVTNDVTGCYTIVDFDVIVHPLPAVVQVEDYIVCEIGTDGFWEFDLESKTAEVLDGQDSLVFAVTYHESQMDAEAAINALVSPYTNISNPQQIFVNITNTLTGCDIATQSFNIEVQEGALANSDMIPILYELCDDNMETDGNPVNDSTQFDLASQNPLVLDGQDPTNYTVSYYETPEDADLGVNPLPLLYENVVNPQEIYVRVDNDTTPTSICYDTGALTLQVHPLPLFDLEDEYLLCLNTNGTEVIEVPVLDTGLSTTDYSFVWTDASNTVVSTDSVFMPIQGGTYTVLVTDLVTGCENTDSTLVNESEPPVVTAQVTTVAFATEHAIQATATGAGISVYEYSLDNGSWQDSGLFTDVTAGAHVVTARDKNGCGEASTEVIVMDYPLYFTPNNDGYHDTWNIYGISSQPNAKIYIFDRYGKLLKQISPTGEGWDGTFNGSPLPSSDYWFSVEYVEPNGGAQKQFNAHFSLKR